MNFWDIEKVFTTMGGEFVTSPIVLSEKLHKIKALVFDWDGVFHSGNKHGDGTSSFSEVDSMGLNMLRFGFYLRNQKIPTTFIVTGENNVTAFDFGKREHLDAIFYKAKNKVKAFDYIQNEYGFGDDEVLFVFDDILDLGMAKRTGVNFLINRKGSPMFHKFVTKNKWCDYKSATSGGEHAVREVCELSLGLMGAFEEVMTNRMNFTELYDTYWQKRNEGECKFFTLKDNQFAISSPLSEL